MIKKSLTLIALAVLFNSCGSNLPGESVAVNTDTTNAPIKITKPVSDEPAGLSETTIAKDSANDMLNKAASKMKDASKKLKDSSK